MIAEVDRHQVASPEDLQRAIERHGKGAPLLLLVRRGAQSMYVAVSL